MLLTKKNIKRNKKHVKLFEKIAGIYSLFFSSQLRSYTLLLKRYKNSFNFQESNTALDIGCGTAALSRALYSLGLEVTALDASKKMLQKAKLLCQDNKINFIQADLSNTLPFSDKSFDYVFSAYVAHGLNPQLRHILYEEGIRLAKKKFILYDYLPNKNIIISIIEWLENGDYFYFKKNINQELDSLSKDYEVIPLSSHSAFYVINI